MRNHPILFLFVCTLLISIPVLSRSTSHYFRLNTDYDASLPTYFFLVDRVRSTYKLPLFNPYVTIGIPVISDPISTTLNPILTPLMIVFGVDHGLKLTFIILYLISGLSMWILLKKVHVIGLLQIWGAALYMTSGNMSAYFASGSIPKFLTYPFIPLIFHFLLFPIKSVKHILIVSLLFTYILFSGYTYLLWFSTILLLTIQTYFILTKKITFQLSLRVIIGIYVIFIIFSSVKLLPFFFEVAPIMVRFFPINPFAGSIHAAFFPFGFIVPLQINFYDRPFFRRIFGFVYNWHEYYAFISPFPLLFISEWKKTWKNNIFKLLTVLVVIGSLYIALKYPYSPFYWLYHFLPFARNFRVPQRIYEPMTVIIILFCVLCAQQWFRNASIGKKKLGFFILTASIISTLSVSMYTLYHAYEPKRTQEEKIVSQLRKNDQQSFYTAVFTCCLHTYLVKEKIPIINYANYGWRPKSSPNFLNAQGDAYNYDMLTTVKPRYLFAPPDKDFTAYGYYPYIQTENIRLWKTDKENIYPKL